MTNLGISCGHHDAALSVVDNNGNILFAAHSERYSRLKNDKLLHSKLLKEANKYNIKTYSYYENPWLKKSRYLINRNWKRVLKRHPKKYLKIPELKCYSHHLTHAAGGFQTSPFNDAAILIVDAIGEWDTSSIWKAHYENNEGNAVYTKLWDMKFPKSLGLLYSSITKRIGLKPNEEEYITMGMAAYGNICYAEELSTLLSDNLHRGIGNWMPNAMHEDLALSVQNVFEEELYKLVKKAKELSQSNNLVYSGGCALNCVANSSISKVFDNIWIMPNPGDAGSSLGSAALTYGKKLNWKGPFLGTDINTGEYPVDEIIRELKSNGIVGVAHGRAEFGPRALGNRSLLADPRGNDIKDRVNKIKHRQKFRPFAPAILAEYAQDYFVMPVKESPFMQFTARCLNPKSFPAIVHVDNTSRVQTVNITDNVGFRSLLEKWYEETDCPMLLNTSLNVKGEPLVNSISDAERFEKIFNVRVLS